MRDVIDVDAGHVSEEEPVLLQARRLLHPVGPLLQRQLVAGPHQRVQEPVPDRTNSLRCGNHNRDNTSGPSLSAFHWISTKESSIHFRGQTYTQTRDTSSVNGLITTVCCTLQISITPSWFLTTHNFSTFLKNTSEIYPHFKKHL